MLCDVEKLLEYLPTQIPDISIRHRKELQYKYRFLEFCMFSIAMNKEKDGRQEMMKKYFRLSSEIDALVALLDRNVYSHIKKWKFHYDELKPIVEQELTHFWIQSQRFKDDELDAPVKKLKDE